VGHSCILQIYPDQNFSKESQIAVIEGGKTSPPPAGSDGWGTSTRRHFPTERQPQDRNWFSVCSPSKPHAMPGFDDISRQGRPVSPRRRSIPPIWQSRRAEAGVFLLTERLCFYSGVLESAQADWKNIVFRSVETGLDGFWPARSQSGAPVALIEFVRNRGCRCGSLHLVSLACLLTAKLH
jgi:hypothetical protein